MTQAPTPQWLDEQYDNRARVPEHESFFAGWREASALVREKSSRRLDLRYGPGPLQTLDLFPSPLDRAPVLVFLHGGWWRALDKSDHSFLAASFTAAGALVAIPNYDLCPAVTMEQIPLQLVQAIGWVARNAPLYGGDPRRLVVAGHSAGGHLAAMMLCCDWEMAGQPQVRLHAALSISGLFDLEPISRTPFLKKDLRLTPESVRQLSPAGYPAPVSGKLYSFVGEKESDEFRRQNRLLRQAWGERVVPVCEEVAGLNHYNVLHELANPKARVHRLALQLLGLGE